MHISNENFYSVYTETCNKIYKILLKFLKSPCSKNLTIPCPANILKIAVFQDTV
jgi:hypothetical protein